MQAGGEFEDAAFAFNFIERLVAAGISYVFAIDHNARIASHLVVQAGVDQVGHGARTASLCTAGFSSACFAGRVRMFSGKGHAGGVKVVGVNVVGDSRNLRHGSFKSALGCLRDFKVQLLFKLVDLLRV